MLFEKWCSGAVSEKCVFMRAANLKIELKGPFSPSLLPSLEQLHHSDCTTYLINVWLNFRNRLPRMILK